MTYIVVEGVIGVGKTALTRLLGQRRGMALLFEQFEENPFLSNFYGDRARYAFQTETFFLLNRYRQQSAVLRPMLEAGDVAADYLFAKTRLFAGMNLAGDELDLFLQIYEALSERTATPDLVVYLHASLDTLMARIYHRDRSFERSMDPGYIASLIDVYDSFFAGYGGAPVLRIDTDQLDFVRDGAAQEELVASIDDALRLQGK
jgi:deoxyguanosine kinase